jgi:predicted metal-dependent hydrolase
VELFHRQEFWESHEVLEGPWREGRSGFYHGLILYASAFVHVQRDNAHGIVAQLEKAERALAPYAPAYLGVAVGHLLQEALAIRRAVREGRNDPPVRWEDALRYPRIRLDEALLRGDEPELGP